MARRFLTTLIALTALLVSPSLLAASTTTVRLPEGPCPERYDVVLHLHGRDPLVLDGLEAAGIEAAVIIVNRGERSTAYQKAFASTTALDRLLLTVEDHWERRGCRPSRGRLALSVWSAGYGGALRLLQEVPHRIDAFVGMDAPYASYIGRSGHIAPPSLKPFLAFARRAARGEVSMAIAHSQVRTPDYASAREVSSAILRALGIRRQRRSDRIAVRDSAAVRKAFAGPLPDLRQRSLAQAKGLWIAGFEGDDASAHVAHLTHASRTVWAQLARAWRSDGKAVEPGQNGPSVPN